MIYSLSTVWVYAWIAEKYIKINHIERLRMFNKDIILYYTPINEIDLSDCSDCINDANAKGLECPYFGVCYDNELLGMSPNTKPIDYKKIIEQLEHSKVLIGD